jgi:hypothetical protein
LAEDSASKSIETIKAGIAQILAIQDIQNFARNC